MPYIYRYIDLGKKECVYVGKVTRHKDIGYDPLGDRHRQHTREQWYKDIGKDNLLLQYIELDSHTDADILETWLISYYNHTGQLQNKAKVGWGKSAIDLSKHIHNLWKNYCEMQFASESELRHQLSIATDICAKHLFKAIKAKDAGGVERLLRHLGDCVAETANNLINSQKLDIIEAQSDFLRTTGNHKETGKVGD